MPWPNKLFLCLTPLDPLRRKGTWHLATGVLVSVAPAVLCPLHFSATCGGGEASVRERTENNWRLKTGAARDLTCRHSSIMLNPLVLAL